MTLAKKTRMMKELSDMICVRNHVFTLANGIRTNAINKNDMKRLLNFIAEVDKKVVEMVLENTSNETQTAVNKKEIDMAESKTKMSDEKKESATSAEKPAVRRGVIQRLNES